MSLDNGIQIANIETELSRLWKKNTSSPTRACLFNLIIFSSDKKRTKYLQDLAYSVAQKFPCRILFFQEDPLAAEDYLKVSVTNEILGKNNVSIANDQINVFMATQQLHRIPFIVLPNLVPDLPVYLLWGQDLTIENKVLSILEQFASRLIYDITCTSNPPMFSKKILSTMAVKPQLDFIDMDWLLTTGWRRALGKVFDSPSALDRLRTSKGIQIRYNNGNAQDSSYKDTHALYVTAWLAGQMEWKFIKQEIKENKKYLTFHNGEGEFEIILSPQYQENLSTASIIEIEVSSKDDHFYFMSLSKDAQKILLHVSTLETCDLPITIPLATQKNEFPYIQELFYSPASSHYYNMLTALSQMDKKG